MNGRILIVDDEADMLVLLSRIIKEETDHYVITENDSQKALTLFRQGPFDLVILDLKMPKISGMEFLGKIKQIQPDVSVVIITAYASIETAVDAIRQGAFEYITKPFQRERILLTIDKVMQWRNIVSENIALREALAKKEIMSPIIGSSPVIKTLIDNIKQVAPTTATVLITGESGTGKELAARAVYRFSLRKEKPFITVNCTAISENVIESELFGHVKGAFTGAWKEKKGLVEMADGGTLFLDEIGDLNLGMQTKLLRLLQEGEYKPVGSTRTMKADIRFIAATNHHLDADIRNGGFREDLFYRLNVIRIEMPGLNQRREDIPLLAFHFLKKYALLYQKSISNISQNALKALSSYDFSGNVRELENMIERGVIFCRTDCLDMKDIFTEGNGGITNVSDEPIPDIYNMPLREARDAYMNHFYRRYIQLLLQRSNGNISRAAETAGIQRQYLHRLIKDVGLETETLKTRTCSV
ncbi:Transcriptional regulatory protein ZraR [Desulfosarcina cetonica]|uniref:sigma-54-dependent transcriptional regulator n=1 Tax=Desulfosarcina cetonica TaxID=90730 RepID=UPI0006D0EDC4|nr:sigma-54 dependent transcriptional regulator [Desulfosarcina cetonica]VTR71152.1 Transcriptional regulatory protein ZraR [Desulfosarcina cetonica]